MNVACKNLLNYHNCSSNLFWFCICYFTGRDPLFFLVPIRCLLFCSLKGFPNVLLCLKHAFASPMHAQYKFYTHSFISQLKCHLFKKRLFGVTNQNYSFSWLVSSIKYCLFPYHKRGPWFEMNGQFEKDRSVNVMTNITFIISDNVSDLGNCAQTGISQGFLARKSCTEL